MADENTPKRAYKRPEDDESNQEIAPEVDNGDVEVEDIESLDNPVGVLGEEPVVDTLKAKIVKMLGLNKSMEYKPWKNLDHWKCNKCNWSTFSEENAKKHYCG